MSGFVSWMLGIVCWVLGIVSWVLGVVFWVLGIVLWVLGIVFWVLGFVFLVLGRWAGGRSAATTATAGPALAADLMRRLTFRHPEQKVAVQKPEKPNLNLKSTNLGF